MTSLSTIPTTSLGYITVIGILCVEVICLASRESKIWTPDGWDFSKVDTERLDSLDRQGVAVRTIDLETPGVYWTQLQPHMQALS